MGLRLRISQGIGFGIIPDGLCTRCKCLRRRQAYGLGFEGLEFRIWDLRFGIGDSGVGFSVRGYRSKNVQLQAYGQYTLG